jgi:TPR repeat protein
MSIKLERVAELSGLPMSWSSYASDGSRYFEEGKYEDAMRCFLKAEEMLDKCEDETLVCAVYHNLGNMHLLGQGCEADAAMAVAFYKKAVARGFESSFHNLRTIYENGHGNVEADAEMVQELNRRWNTRSLTLSVPEEAMPPMISVANE